MHACEGGWGLQVVCMPAKRGEGKGGRGGGGGGELPGGPRGRVAATASLATDRPDLMYRFSGVMPKKVAPLES